MIDLITILSAIAFLGYGISCIATVHMDVEFTRYGLPQYRKLTGYLQILGALGLFLGFASPLIGAAASGGLALQMLLGVGVRIKIKDSILQATPATFFMCLNAYLCYLYIGKLQSV